MGIFTSTLPPPPPPQIVPEPIDLGSTASAVTLARDIAGLINAPLDEVWCSLCNVPENMLVLLDSPQGWSALAGYIACDLGVLVPEYLPGVH